MHPTTQNKITPNQTKEKEPKLREIVPIGVRNETERREEPKGIVQRGARNKNERDHDKDARKSTGETKHGRVKARPRRSTGKEKHV